MFDLPNIEGKTVASFHKDCDEYKIIFTDGAVLHIEPVCNAVGVVINFKEADNG